MSTVGIKELKNRLTHYMRLAKTGEEIIVTERDKPVALIQKIEAVKQPKSEEAILAQMVAEGSIIPAKRRGPLPRFKPVKIKGKVEGVREVLAALDGFKQSVKNKVLRKGVNPNLHRPLLTTVGCTLFSFVVYGPLAFIYWFFLFKNLLDRSALTKQASSSTEATE